MREHGHTDRLGTGPDHEGGPRTVTALEATGADQEPHDLIFAFSGGEELDLYGLSLLLTARQMAHEDHKSVWVAGLSRRSWLLLEALGLEGLFKPFPPSDELGS